MGVPFIILLVFALRWTNPTQEAHGCAASGPLNDLGWIEVWGSVSPNPALLLVTLPAVGREGMEEAVTLDLSGTSSGWVTAFDAAGNASCSTPWSVNTTTDVTSSTVQPRPPAWYDIAGRKIERPVRSGVYFFDSGTGAPRKVVVLR